MNDVCSLLTKCLALPNAVSFCNHRPMTAPEKSRRVRSVDHAIDILEVEPIAGVEILHLDFMDEAAPRRLAALLLNDPFECDARVDYQDRFHHLMASPILTNERYAAGKLGQTSHKSLDFIPRIAHLLAAFHLFGRSRKRQDDFMIQAMPATRGFSLE